MIKQEFYYPSADKKNTDSCSRMEAKKRDCGCNSDSTWSNRTYIKI